MRTLDLKSGATRSYPAGINRSRSDAHHFMLAWPKQAKLRADKTSYF